MAMATCRECGKDVSTEAKACPHCGAPKPVKQLGGCALLLILLGIVVVIGIAMPSDSTTSGGGSATPTFNFYAMVDGAKEQVRQRLKDPESARWSGIKVVETVQSGNAVKVVCGTVNSKNSFGGYAGPSRWLSNGLNVTALESDLSGGEFDELWRKTCVGRVLHTQ